MNANDDLTNLLLNVYFDENGYIIKKNKKALNLILKSEQEQNNEQEEEDLSR